MKTSETYQCQMRCEGDKTYDKPGNCPVCNMKLMNISLQESNSEKMHNIDTNLQQNELMHKHEQYA